MESGKKNLQVFRRQKMGRIKHFHLLNLKNALKTICFFCLGIIIFIVVQKTLTPKRYSEQNSFYVLSGLDSLEPETIDVLFLGSSSTAFSISPMQLYEQTGICSYNLAISGQTLECSYYLIKRALEKQNPSVVVLGVNGLFYKENVDSVSWRYILDVLPTDKNKIELSQCFGNKKSGDSALTAIFPIIKYHSRWEELEKRDFEFRDRIPYYSMGQYIVSSISANSITQDQVDSIIDTIASLNEKDEIYFQKNGELGQTVANSTVNSPEICQYNKDYINKINDICKSHNAELVLVKIPSISYPQSGDPWTQQKNQLVKELANNIGIKYYDMVYDDHNVVDFMSDSIDAGHHLNLRGAQKVTNHIQQYLLNNFKLTKNPNNFFDEMLKKYKKMEQIALLESNTDFTSYVTELINNLDKWDIFIASSEEYISGLNQDDLELLKTLGLNIISDGGFANSYLAVIKDGLVEYEAYSTQNITYKTNLYGNKVSMTSSGWYYGSKSNIYIGGNNYCLNIPGLNFVIMDKETGLLIDSVGFRTRYPEKIATHSGNLTGIIHAYEDRICFGL